MAGPGTDLGSETRDSTSRERGYLDICSEGFLGLVVKYFIYDDNIQLEYDSAGLVSSYDIMDVAGAGAVCLECPVCCHWLSRHITRQPATFLCIV